MALSDMSAPSEVPRSPGKLGDGARLQLIIGEVERLNRIKERKRKKDKKKASKAKRWAPVTALVESKGTASQSPFQANTEGKKHKSTKKKKRRDSQDQPYAAPSLSAPFPLDNSNPEEGHSPKKKKKKKNQSAASSGASQEDPPVASETPISSPESLQVSQSAKKKKKRKRMKDSEQDAETLRDERTSAPGSPPYHLLNPGPSEIQMSSAQSPKKDKKRKSRKLFVLEEPSNRTLTEDSEAEKGKSPKKKKKKRDKGENSAITAPPGEQELAESELAVQSGSFVYPGLSDVPMSSTESKERSTKQKKRKKRKRKHSETQENLNPQDETLSQSIIPPFLPPSSPPTAKKAKTTGAPVAPTKDSTPKKDWFGRVKGTKKVNSSSASAQEQHQQVRKVPQHRVRAEFSPTHEGDVSRPLFSEDFWDDLDQAVDNNDEGGGKDREKKKKVKKKSAASAPTLDLDPSSSFEIRAPPSTAPSAEEGAGEEGGSRGLESPAEQARPAEGVEDAEPSEESDREALVSESAAASPPRGARRAAKTPELLSGLSLHRHVTAEDEKKRREVEEKKRRLRKRMVFRTVEEEQEEEENQESEEDLANQAKISSPIRFVALNKDSDEDSTTPDRDTPPPARDSQDSARNNAAAEIERSGSDEENVSADATSASSPSKKTGDKSSKTSPRKSPRKEPPPASPPAQLAAQLIIPQPPSSPKRKPPRPSLLFSPAACSTRNNTLLPPGTPPPRQTRSSPRKKTPEKSAVPPEVAPVTSERSPGKASPRRPSPPGAAPGTKRSPSRSPEKRNDKTTGAEATPSPKRGSKVSSPPPARKRRNGSPMPPARSPPEMARYEDEDEEESDGEQTQHPPTVASSRPEEEEEDEAEGSEHEEGGEEEGSSPEEGEGEAGVSLNGESPAPREVEGGEQNREEEEEEDVRHDRERNRKLLGRRKPTIIKNKVFSSIVVPEMTEIEILEGNPRMRSRAELEEEDVRVREEIEGAAVASKAKKEEARRKRLSGIDDEAEAGGVRASQHEQQRPRQLVDSLMSAKIPRPQFQPGDNRHLKKAISWILDGNDFPLPELQFSFRSTFGAPSRAEQRRVKRDIPHYT